MPAESGRIEDRPGRDAHEPRGPLSFPAYRRIFIARVISSAGSYMQIVGATWLVYQLSHSATAVGLLAALALGPALIGSPIGGALADRFDTRRLAIVLSLCQAVPIAVMAGLAFADVLTVPWIYVCVLVGAIPFSLNQPVLALIVPATVPPRFRHLAVSRTSLAYNMTRLVGAVIGGAVVAAIGAGAAFAINAASYVVVAIVLGLTQLPGDTGSRRRHSVGVRRGLSRGWHFPTVQVVAVSAAVFFTLAAPLEQLMPGVARKHSDSALAVGVLLGAMGVGALLANPFLSRRLHDAGTSSRALATGLTVTAVGLFALAMSPGHIAVDIGALMVIGAGWEFVFVSGQSTLAIDIPDDIKGRMIGLFFVLVTATTAVGALVVGYLFDTIGLQASLLLDTVVVAMGAAYVGIRVRKRDLWHTRSGQRGQGSPPEGVARLE